MPVTVLIKIINCSRNAGETFIVNQPIVHSLLKSVKREIYQYCTYCSGLCRVRIHCQRPISSRYRRLPLGKLEAAKKEFAEMEAQGIIRKAKCSWALPLHIMEKADGTWRPCGDYKLLNIATKPDLYPPPHMEDLSARLSSKKVFNKLDLRKGYYQVPVSPGTSRRLPSSPPFGCTSFSRCLSGCAMLGSPSSSS